MKEFIKEFGKDNFIIMIAIVGVIVLILTILLIIEKRSAKKMIKQELSNIKNNMPKAPAIRKAEKHEEKKVEAKKEEVKIEQFEEPEEIEELEPVREVYYAPTETTVEEAKEKLEQVTKRLIDEQPNNLIDHTTFETEQEEKSIISYEELLKASHNIDEKNDKLLEDETEAAITIEELYKKHQEEQSIIDGIDAVNEKSKVSNPVFVEENKKFKNSDVISPVFGIYSGKVKPSNVLKEIDKTVKPKDLEDEIQRTEDFLSELKKLKNKLD